MQALYQAQSAPSGIQHWRARQAPAAQSGDTVRIATYNVKNLFDDQDENPNLGTTEKPAAEQQALANNIRNSGSQVLALQEVESLEVLQNFVEKYLPGEFSEVVLVEGNDRRGIDVALLSKFPVQEVISHKDHQFPLADGSGQTSFNRDLLRVDLDIRGIPLTVYTSHFKSKRGGSASDNERIAEAQETRRILAQEMAPFEKANFVVMGDLNDRPTSTTLKVLTEEWEGQPALVSSLEGLPPAERGTYPSKKPKDQIDHILFPEHMRDNLEGSRVYKDSESRLASDHLMVTADFRLTQPQ
jgi:endonuclease/exonuclease/phosphatase family metal-dependent hydrolase